jgi:hypothetical protein
MFVKFLSTEFINKLLFIGFRPSGQMDNRPHKFLYSFCLADPSGESAPFLQAAIASADLPMARSAFPFQNQPQASSVLTDWPTPRFSGKDNADSKCINASLYFF